MSNSGKENRLAQATSPYLLQHAGNPVDWYEWGAEALERATAEDKPILVSIGYSACHWCHVMERECFENEEIARLMNEAFICIKIDREERPDIDQIYMEAVQAMGINGGWPLHVFLTPDQKPFYGGTYFPPPHWINVLQGLQKAFAEKRDEINKSAGDISQHLNLSDLQRFASAEASTISRESMEKAFTKLVSTYDEEWGGLGKAPKFVMPSIWLFLLRYYVMTQEKKAVSMVVETLTQMTLGGLYDTLAGGFSRYSVDAKWFVPHFEKMLYDNAQLLTLYSEAYTLTRNPRFRKILQQTLQWLRHEMRDSSGGFYSALDADSEGVEGKFYSWTQSEFEQAASQHHALASAYYQVTDVGNWEAGANILRQVADPDQFAQDHNMSPVDLDRLMDEVTNQLLAIRNNSVHPGCDDKMLAGWNAMTVKGLIDAYMTLGDSQALDMALAAISFIERELMSDQKLYRSYKGRRSATEGFLEDYAFLIQAYLSLYQATFHEEWLHKGRHLCHYVIDQFYDERETSFFFTSNASEKLIARKKETFDNVIPSSNSVMARNLHHLGVLIDREEWRQIGHTMCLKLSNLIPTEPAHLSNWAIALGEYAHGLTEVAIVGSQCEAFRKEIKTHYLPFSLLLGTKNASSLPLLINKPARSGKTYIYVCQNGICKLPVHTPEEALALMRA